MQNSIDNLFDQHAKKDLIMDAQGLGVDQQGVNVDANQADEMTHVKESIIDRMWENYRRS